MRLPFRHGIVSSQTAPFLFYNSSGYVDLLANNKPFTVNIAHKTSNYLHSEDNTVTSAWQGIFSPTVNYYLYMEFDSKTFARTFGHTTEAPQFGPTAPLNPTLETTWFNTDTMEQFKWIGSTYARVNRIFVCRMNNRNFFSLSMNAPAFTGTQIGDTSSVLSGRIMYSEYGNPVLRDNKTFMTTEDQFFTNQSQVIGVRLESNITTAKCSDTSLHQYEIVTLAIDGTIRSAVYSDVEDRVIAVVTEDLLIGEVGNIVIQGTVRNPAWDFSAYPSGAKLWVHEGRLIASDPHKFATSTFPSPQVPVAKVLSKNSVIFEQGLGGVGPTGPAGSIDALPPATTTSLGAVLLSVPPVAASQPIVVGRNDPILVGAPFAAGVHTHAASAITVSNVGDVSAPNVQLAIQELDTEKFPTAGGTLTGDVTFGALATLNADPLAPLEAATKRYVDNLTSGLRWLDPVCLANLIGDDVFNPTSLTPQTGDAYIVPDDAEAAWSAYPENTIVRWDGSAWISGGIFNTTNFPELRFLIAGTSTTPASGSFVGRERQVATYVSPAGSPIFTVPVNTNAVYICNAFSAAAFNQYVYDLDQDRWIQTGGGANGIAVDGLTITQAGNTISTITHANGGTVDAATYRGQDLDNVYSPLVHTHNATTITVTGVPRTATNIGTPTTAADTQIVGGNVSLALNELLNKKASKQPIYTNVGDLPAATGARGMVAHVINDNTYRVAIQDTGVLTWVPIAVNDGTVQNHSHRINYDLTFYGAGPVAANANAIIARTMIPRVITIPPNSLFFARVISAPAVTITFQIFKNGVNQNIPITLDPSVNGGLFTNGNTGAGNFAFAPGDYIDLVAPSTQDTSVADLALSIVCVSETGTP